MVKHKSVNIGMSSSPIGRIYIKKRSVPEARDTIVPEEIRLPDGRVFKTAELMGKKTKSVSYNLRSKTRTQAIKTRTKGESKYTWEERVWISNNSVEAVQEKYGLDPFQARGLIVNSRGVLKYQSINDSLRDEQNGLK